jgi:hypothetical protein
LKMKAEILWNSRGFGYSKNGLPRFPLPGA